MDPVQAATSEEDDQPHHGHHPDHHVENGVDPATSVPPYTIMEVSEERKKELEQEFVHSLEDDSFVSEEAGAAAGHHTDPELTHYHALANRRSELLKELESINTQLKPLEDAYSFAIPTAVAAGATPSGSLSPPAAASPIGLPNPQALLAKILKQKPQGRARANRQEADHNRVLHLTKAMICAAQDQTALVVCKSELYEVFSKVYKESYKGGDPPFASIFWRWIGGKTGPFNQHRFPITSCKGTQYIRNVTYLNPKDEKQRKIMEEHLAVLAHYYNMVVDQNKFFEMMDTLYQNAMREASKQKKRKRKDIVDIGDPTSPVEPPSPISPSAHDVTALAALPPPSVTTTSIVESVAAAEAVATAGDTVHEPPASTEDEVAVVSQGTTADTEEPAAKKRRVGPASTLVASPPKTPEEKKQLIIELFNLLMSSL